MPLAIARSLEAALDALEAQPEARPIAGGVGVMLGRSLGDPAHRPWIGVARVPELRVRDVADGWARIGAATTLAELVRWPLTPPLLTAAAAATANAGIREMATLGGNVVAGRSDSDLAAALVALGAHAVVAHASGTRVLDVETLVDDGVAAGAVVTRFELPSRASGWGWQRVTTRGAMDGAAVTVAVALGARPRVTAAFVSPALLRLARVEAAIARSAGPADIRAAAVADVAGSPVRMDLRASSAYRREVIPVLVARAVADALRRQGADD